MADNDRNVVISKQEGWTVGSSSEWYDLFKPIDANADESNKITMAPLESGITHFDGKVYDPTKIEVVGYVSIQDVDRFLGLAHAAMDEMDFHESLYSVSTKGSTYNDLIMTGLKESDMKDIFDQIKYTISFVMAIIDDDQYAKNNEGNSKTQRAGLVGGWFENGIHYSF